MKTLRVLISHVSYQASVGSFIKMLRNSKKYNCYIIGCDLIRKGYSSGSMLIDKFYHIPYFSNNYQYLETIQKICKEEKIMLIISAEEEDLILFKNNKLPQALYETIPDISLFTLFRDKHLANSELLLQGIIVPKTLKDNHEFQSSNKERFIWRKRLSCCSRGIKIFEKNEITSEYEFFTDNSITQEFIDGKEYTVDVMCDKWGNIRMIVPRETLAVKDGTTFKCTIKRNNSIIELCKKIYSIYCIPGISNIQFIVDKEHIYFIELNLRAAATLIASSLASINFLDLYISHFLFNEELPSYESLMETIRWEAVISRYYEETILYENEDR